MTINTIDGKVIFKDGEYEVKKLEFRKDQGNREFFCATLKKIAPKKGDTTYDDECRYGAQYEITKKEFDRLTPTVSKE